jgi:ornithine carbamoyltransferase
MMKDLRRIADLSAADLQLLLDEADAVRADPHLCPDLLVGGAVALCFAKPSTSAHMAFQTAITRLGGKPLTIGPDELLSTRGETLADGTRVHGRSVRAIVVCGFADADLRQVAAAASVPVVNALSDRHDPCQTLAGLLTLRQQWGALAGHKVAYVGNGGNVAHSLLEAAALAGMDVAVATPYGLEPYPAVVARARGFAAQRGCRVELTLDPVAAVRGADAVVTDVWMSMHDPERARAARAHLLEAFRVDGRLMAAAKPNAVFLHCLPAHRGEEVTSEVIDGPRSLVLQQAANLAPIAQAVLCTLLQARLHGHHDGPPVPDDTGPLAAAITDAIASRRDLPAGARTA